MNTRPVGEHGLLIELPGIDEVHQLRANLLASHHPGVAEIVAGLRSVLVVVDPARTSVAEFGSFLEDLDVGDVAPPSSRIIDVPVIYDGPDLDEVAKLTDVSADQVVARHQASTYTVAFLGFSAGFAYLLGLDQSLHVPRRTTPRPSVAAGSVAIAGELAAVYPRATPGGWRLLGHTELPVWDLSRDRPALFAPGDTVRFRGVG
ncbi:MAG: 5-oxoprolinase subunit PxpB [Acidimicrobiales bacterium]